MGCLGLMDCGTEVGGSNLGRVKTTFIFQVENVLKPFFKSLKICVFLSFYSLHRVRVEDRKKILQKKSRGVESKLDSKRRWRTNEGMEMRKYISVQE